MRTSVAREASAVEAVGSPVRPYLERKHQAAPEIVDDAARVQRR